MIMFYLSLILNAQMSRLKEGCQSALPIKTKEVLMLYRRAVECGDITIVVAPPAAVTVRIAVAFVLFYKII